MAEHNDYDKITRQAGETAENRNKADPGKEKTSSTRSRGKKTLRVGGYSVLACLMVLAICVAVNILADKLPTSVSSLDLSSNKVYSLSDESRDLVKGLDEDVTIYWLVQNGKEDVPVKNILDRYESAGKHITVKRIDPDVYPNFAEQYSVSGTVYNNSLVIENKNQEASSFIYKLAYLYRYMIENEEENLVTIREELDFVNEYTDLMKVRFGSSFDVVTEVDETIMANFVVPCSIQLLIENAIKHNGGTAQTPLNIRIYNTATHIVIWNNRLKKNTCEPTTHIGLNYIQKLYNDLSPKELKVKSTDEEFVVELPIIR